MSARYWVIAPYDSTETDIFDRVWDYDLRNGTIAIGFKNLGDTSSLSRAELESRCHEVYGEVISRHANTVWRFYHEVAPGNVMVARRGRKKIIGVGSRDSRTRAEHSLLDLPRRPQ